MSSRNRSAHQAVISIWTEAWRRNGKLGEKRGMGEEQNSGRQGCRGT